MFENLTNGINKIFDNLFSRGIITEAELDVALRNLRISLLEADVALAAVKDFISRIKEKALHQQVVKSITPKQMIMKIIHDELVFTLQNENEKDSNLLLSKSKNNTIMMVGLQGSGKTTTSAKIANFIKKNLNKNPFLVSLDTYRPAAQKQLEVLAKSVNIDCLTEGNNPIKITKEALEKTKNYDVTIFDTAGRTQLDEKMMLELKEIYKLILPSEVIFVADSMMGQDAINVANAFSEAIDLTGVVLTRVDSDSKGGAILSIKHITNKPIKFLGFGEKIDDLQEFDSERIASRILGFGDIASLVEKAQNAIDKDEIEKISSRMQKGLFNLNDYMNQLRQMKKIGNMKGLISMIPGIAGMKQKIEESGLANDKTIDRQIAIICSMTKKERKNPSILNFSRKKRISAGSGSSAQEINRLLKQYEQISSMMKAISSNKGGFMEKIKSLMKSNKIG